MSEVIVKTAILSHVIPPMPTGQSIVLARLTSNISPTSLVFVMRSQYFAHNNSETHVTISKGLCIRDFRSPILRKFATLFNFCSATAFGIADLVRLIGRHGVDQLVVCSGDPYLIPIGVMAGRITGKRIIVYLFDHYSEQWKMEDIYSIVKRTEPWVLNRSDLIVVPNEFLETEIAGLSSTPTVLIRNPIGGDDRIRAPVRKQIGTDVSIVYTGTVYHAHFDAIRNLLAAIDMIRDRSITLHIHTHQSREDLEEHGISGRVIVHPFVGGDEILSIQANADLLFLPLSFESQQSTVMRTSAPGKMGEYLSSGNLILVHAPKDTFLSWFFRKNHCGVVCSDSDPSALAQQLTDILASPDQVEEMKTNATGVAEQFRSDVSRAKFLEVLSSGGQML